MIRAVVFDLDGTLLDTIPDIAEALNRALVARGFPARDRSEYNYLVGGGIMEAICRATPPGTSQEEMQEINKVYQGYYPDHSAVHTTYYPGIQACLSTLLEKGLALGILSNKTETTTQRIIASYFGDIPFRFIFGNNGQRALKPSTEAAGPICQALGMAPEEIAYVGDSGSDMVFARDAGMLPVAALWGYRTEKELRENGAVLLPATPSELAELL